VTADDQITGAPLLAAQSPHQLYVWHPDSADRRCGIAGVAG